MTENDEAFERYVSQAQADIGQGKLQYAIANYQRAIALQTSHVWLHQALGELLVKTNRIEDALACYKKAYSLDASNDRTYVLIGQAMAKKGLISEGIASYYKAIALAPQPVWVHKSLAELLQKRAASDYVRSAISYIQVMQLQDRFHSHKLLQNTLRKAPELSLIPPVQQVQMLRRGYSQQPAKDFVFPQQLATLGFLQSSRSPVNPASYYFVNEQLKVIYCSIPKNACTLFKTMLVEHSDLKSEFETSQQNVHPFLNQKAASTSASTLLERLDSSEYYKFTVLRNPFHRIVSGYLDKFAKHLAPEPFVQVLIKNLQASLGIAQDIRKSITFRQFIDYLVSTPDHQLNDDGRPKHNFIAAVKFDFVGQFEAIDEVVTSLEQTFSIQIKKKVSAHATRYKHFSEDTNFCDLYPSELRALEGMPQAQQMFSEDLKIKIQSRYCQDIETYEKAFNISASNL